MHRLVDETQSRLSLALTIDDAPTIAANAEGVNSDSKRMDQMRDILKRAGIRHCVAFVIGSLARSDPSPLRRWLRDGYELGNHTEYHQSASKLAVDDFVRSVELCDELLQSVGAFEDGRTRWFRFPYLDRGVEPTARRSLQRRIEGLGYRVAHATVDFLDHLYEVPIAAQLATGDVLKQGQIVERYVSGALNNLVGTPERLGVLRERSIPLVGFLHFGATSALALCELVNRLGSLSVEYCSLEQALSHPVYCDFDADFSRTGLVIASQVAVSRRLARRLVRLSQRLNLFRQRELGPLLPGL